MCFNSVYYAFDISVDDSNRGCFETQPSVSRSASYIIIVSFDLSLSSAAIVVASDFISLAGSRFDPLLDLCLVSHSHAAANLVLRMFAFHHIICLKTAIFPVLVLLFCG